MPEAILFDLDGTLADTAPDLGGALNRLRAEFGLAPLPLERLRPVTSEGSRGMLRLGFGLTPHHPDYDEYRQRFLDIYDAALCVHTQLFEGIAPLLDALEARDLPWGVVTNKPERFTLPLIAALGLSERAACVVSGDSAPAPKPAPDPLFLACRMIDRVPDRCLYVGDDARDIEAGRAAGMTTVAVRYGYLGEHLPPEEWGADHLIDHPLDLLKLA